MRHNCTKAINSRLQSRTQCKRTKSRERVWIGEIEIGSSLQSEFVLEECWSPESISLSFQPNLTPFVYIKIEFPFNLTARHILNVPFVYSWLASHSSLWFLRRFGKRVRANGSKGHSFLNLLWYYLPPSLRLLWLYLQYVLKTNKNFKAE